LDPEFYRGDAAVHWTLTVFDRATGWLNASFHCGFRELLLHAAAREGLYHGVMTENSPAFQRRGWDSRRARPEGTVESIPQITFVIFNAVFFQQC
jgi:hypothetical protein